MIVTGRTVLKMSDREVLATNAVNGVAPHNIFIVLAYLHVRRVPWASSEQASSVDSRR